MAKDVFHNHVKEALIKDGWTILKDPLSITVDGGDRRVEIDLSAEKILIATKETEKIAIEIKSFLSASLLNEFNSALGQYLTYRDILTDFNYSEILYLAIRLETYDAILLSPFIQKQIRRYRIKLLVVSVKTKEVKTWIR